MAETSAKENLKSIFGGLKNVAADLTTLEVTTLTGDIKLLLDKSGTGDKKTYNFKNKDALMNLIGESAQPDSESEIKIVAYSRIDFDQDVINFVKKDLTDDERKLYDLHLESMKTSQEARAGFLTFLAGLFD